MLSEFDLIARYFVRPQSPSAAVALGIGDDCALLTPREGHHWAVSSDMLVEGQHFFPNADPEALGHKCLAVNLSDLAAMGAQPVAFTLALALPNADPAWLAPFSEGLFGLADAHGCALVGGDTTRGPLTVCITIFGAVAAGAALRRDAARPGDAIWVSGQLGDARLALAHLRRELALDEEDLPAVCARLHRPQPRVALGIALRGIAHAAIDVSDGLVGDLRHILERSGCGASLHADKLPVSAVLGAQPDPVRRRFALAGGDDYELCFTAPADRHAAIEAAGRSAGVAVTRIGTVDAEPGLRLLDSAGAPLAMELSGFDHFAQP